MRFRRRRCVATLKQFFIVVRSNSSLRFSPLLGSSQGVDNRENPINLNTDYVEITKRWIEGEEWEDIVEASNRQEGDVARVLVRVADVLRQFGDVSGLENCREAREIIMREPVSDIFQ